MRTTSTLANYTGHVCRAAHVSLTGQPDRTTPYVRKLEDSGRIAEAIDGRRWSDLQHKRRLVSTVVDEIVSPTYP